MTEEVKHERVICSHQAENARFLLECDFSKQYSHYYRKRLEKTRPFIEFNCRARWEPSIPLYSLVELAQITNSEANVSLGQISRLSQLPTQEESSLVSFEHSKRLKPSPDQAKGITPQLTSTQKTPTIWHQHGRSPQPEASPIIRAGCSRQIMETPQSSAQTEQEAIGNRCIVIGTIFKRMKLQPDVIEELSYGNFTVSDRYPGHYTSQEDRLVLEDSDESISLTGNIDPKRFVTGITVGLLGSPIDDGSQFMVFDVCFAEPNRTLLFDDCDEQDELIGASDTSFGAPRQNSSAIYVMLVSGLGFHQDMDKENYLTKALQNMIDFIFGGSDFSEDERSSRVARILVLGDSLLKSRSSTDEDGCSQKGDVLTKMKQSRQVKQYSGSVQAVKHMDDFFALLSKTIHVDVMPGASDPSSHLFPQQPFHPCMFQKSCMFSTFSCTTNPYHAIYNDSVDILATSGQNIDIVSKFSEIRDPIEVMKCHLMWGNCAPSAPDNLFSVPDENDDPFVIDFIPDIYVSGCQKLFQSDFFYYMNDGCSVTPKIQETDPTHQPETNASSQQSYGEKSESQVHHRPIRNSETHVESSELNSWARKKSRTLLVTVPRFSETKSCVLLDLRTLKPELISFGGQ